MRFENAIKFFLMSILLGIFLYIATGNFSSQSALGVTTTVLIVSVPIALVSIYIGTVRQTQRLEVFKERGWIYFFRSRRPFNVLLWALLSVPLSYFTLLQLQGYSTLEWAAFAFVPPVLYVMLFVIKSRLSQELKPYLVHGLALQYARYATATLVMLLYLLAMSYFQAAEESISLKELINTEKLALTENAGSALVYESATLLAWYNGIKAYSLGLLAGWQWDLRLLVTALGSWVLFFNFSTLLASLLIPRMELRRILLPLTDSDKLTTVSPGNIALISAISAIVVMVYYSGATAIEAKLQSESDYREFRAESERRAYALVEMIDGVQYRTGTIAAIEQAKQDYIARNAEAIGRVRKEANTAFDQMEERVDPFLDWYYTLSAEYLRTLNILTGNIEDYLAENLKTHLQEADAFAPLQRVIEQSIAAETEAHTALRAKVEAILKTNRLPASVINKEARVVLNSEGPVLPSLKNPAFESRLTASAGSGAVAGTLTSALVAKIIANSSLKVAAQTLAKMAATKYGSTVAGAGVGAAAGAAAGSIVPVLGTAVGAAIGGVVAGIGTALTADYAMLKLDEALNREEFKQELLRAIEATKSEYLARLPATKLGASSRKSLVEDATLASLRYEEISLHFFYCNGYDKHLEL